MDKFDILKTILENIDPIIDTIITGIETSPKRTEYSQKLWNILLQISPPEEIYYLIYQFYQLHPKEFLALIEKFKQDIVEILYKEDNNVNK